MFVYWLIKQLDQETPGWRANTVFLMDGAAYHRSEKARKYFASLKLEVIYTGPYAYTSSPVEKLFEAMKRGDLNPNGVWTGKR